MLKLKTKRALKAKKVMITKKTRETTNLTTQKHPTALWQWIKRQEELPEPYRKN